MNYLETAINNSGVLPTDSLSVATYIRTYVYISAEAAEAVAK